MITRRFLWITFKISNDEMIECIGSEIEVHKENEE